MSMAGPPGGNPPPQYEFRKVVSQAPRQERDPDLPGEFLIGQVIERAFSIVVANIIPFGILVILATGFSFSYTFVTWNLGQFGNSTVGYLLAISDEIVSSLLSYLLAAALAFGTFQKLAGRDVVRVRDCLLRAVNRLLPLVVVAAFAWVALVLVDYLINFIFGSGGIFIAVLAKIVLYSIVSAILWVAVPVAVFEREANKKSGGFYSVLRGINLINGYGRKIFGIALLFIILNIAIPFALGVFLVPIASAGVFEIFAVVLAASIGALSAAAAAVSYQKLRELKEGVSAEEIAAESE